MPNITKLCWEGPVGILAPALDKAVSMKELMITPNAANTVQEVATSILKTNQNLCRCKFTGLHLISESRLHHEPVPEALALGEAFLVLNSALEHLFIGWVGDSFLSTLAKYIPCMEGLCSFHFSTLHNLNSGCTLLLDQVPSSQSIYDLKIVCCKEVANYWNHNFDEKLGFYLQRNLVQPDKLIHENTLPAIWAAILGKTAKKSSTGKKGWMDLLCYILWQRLELLLQASAIVATAMTGRLSGKKWSQAMMEGNSE